MVQMSHRLLVIQHQENCPPAGFADWVHVVGVGTDVLEAPTGRAIPAALPDHSGLVVLGGSMNASDDDTVPWLPAVRALIATTVSSGIPFLGICLGHQLAAVALGGTVGRNPQGSNRGLSAFTPNAAGREDPLLRSVLPGALSIQSNRDVVLDMPSGSRVLATFADGTVQAARFGERAWGVQFHPEANADIFQGWLDQESPRVSPEARAAFPELAAAVRAADAGLRRSWEPLARRFAQLVKGAARLTGESA